MTRRAGFKIYECPKCGKEYARSMWGSINFSVYVPGDAFANGTVCVGCGHKYEFEDAVCKGWLPEPKPLPWWKRWWRSKEDEEREWKKEIGRHRVIPEFLRKQAD